MKSAWRRSVAGAALVLVGRSAWGAVTPEDGIPQELSACFMVEPDYEAASVEEERQFLSCFLVAYNEAMDGMGYTLEELRILSDFELEMFVQTSLDSGNATEATSTPSSAPSTEPSDVPTSIPSWVTGSKWTQEEPSPEPPTFSPSAAPARDALSCPPGHTGLVPADQCTRYFNCMNGQMYGSVGTCPEGLLFNQEEWVCSAADTVLCFGTSSRGVDVGPPPTLQPSSTPSRQDTSSPTSQPSPSFSVTRLVLVNAETNTDVVPLEEGITVNLTAVGARLDVRAETSGSVTSVRFGLDSDPLLGTDYSHPYSLAEEQGNFRASSALAGVGSHRITATPFSAFSASWGPAHVVNFNVTGFGITGFSLVDTQSGAVIQRLGDDDVVDLDEVGTSLAIQAETTASVDGVYMSSTSLGYGRFQDSSPFTLAEKNTSNSHTQYESIPELRVPGLYSVSATPWMQLEQGIVANITLRVVNDTVQQRHLTEISLDGAAISKKKKKSKTGVGGKGSCNKCVLEVMPAEDCPGCLTRRNLQDFNPMPKQEYGRRQSQRILDAFQNAMQEKHQARHLQGDKNSLIADLFSTCLGDANRLFGHFASYGGLNASSVQIDSCTEV